MEIPLKTACASHVQAEAALIKDSFQLYMGGRNYGTARECVSQAFINNQDGYEALQEEYYKTAMDYIAGDTFQQGIYLA